MVISSEQILRWIDENEGVIVIDPLDRANIKGASINVSLGEWYFRMQRPDNPRIRNVYAKNNADTLWGKPHKAKPLSETTEDYCSKDDLRELSASIHPQESVIWFAPDEIILAHTHEFIGSTNSLVGDIRGRSSLGRSAFRVTGDHTWGDPGYIGRWSLFIQNMSHDYVPLVVRRTIAQLVFHEVVGAKDYHHEGPGGKYQDGTSLEEVKAKWRPESILPKTFKDREVANSDLLIYAN